MKYIDDFDRAAISEINAQRQIDKLRDLGDTRSIASIAEYALACLSHLMEGDEDE